MGNFNEKYFKTEGAVRQDVNAIDSVLAEGEEILWRAKPKKKRVYLGENNADAADCPVMGLL